MALNESSNSTDITECKATKPVPNCGMVSWAFTQTPLAPPFLRPSNSNSNSKPCNYVCPIIILRDLQSSIMSTADKCFRFLHLFASENPVLNKLLSLSSEFHAFRKQVTLSLSLRYSVRECCNCFTLYFDNYIYIFKFLN